MRKSGWTPSIVPISTDKTVYLVMDDLGRLGRIWREANVDQTDLETVIMDMLEGQYDNPIGVFGFHPFEGWSQDVSADVAQELRRRCDLQLRDVPGSIVDFVERHEGAGGRQLTLRPRAVRYRRLALAEQDREKVELLYKIADEAGRSGNSGHLRLERDSLKSTRRSHPRIGVIDRRRSADGIRASGRRRSVGAESMGTISSSQQIVTVFSTLAALRFLGGLI
jgi:hypothetical protein